MLCAQVVQCVDITTKSDQIFRIHGLPQVFRFPVLSLCALWDSSLLWTSWMSPGARPYKRIRGFNILVRCLCIIFWQKGRNKFFAIKVFFILDQEVILQFLCWAEKYQLNESLKTCARKKIFIRATNVKFAQCVVYSWACLYHFIIIVFCVVYFCMD